MLDSFRQLLKQMVCHIVTIGFLRDFSVLKIHLAYTFEKLWSTMVNLSDALAKLLIEKGLINQAEFMVKLKAERATYQEIIQQRIS